MFAPYWKCKNFCDDRTQQSCLRHDSVWTAREILTRLELIFYQSAQRDHRTQNIIMIKRDILKYPKGEMTAPQQSSNLDGNHFSGLLILCMYS